MNKQQLITKYGKKFSAGKDEKTAALKGAHYAANGSVFVTNRHYGLRIRNAHSFNQALTLDIRTGTPIEGEFPHNYEKVFPRDYKDIIFLPAGAPIDGAVGSARAALAVATEVNHRLTTAKMIADNGVVRLSVESDILDIEFKAFFGNTESIKPSKRTFDVSYLLTALQVFQDADRGARVWLNGPLDPILITDGEDIDVVILPYRTAD